MYDPEIRHSRAVEFPAVGSARDPLPDPLAQIVVRPALDPEGGSSGGSAGNRQTWLNADAVTVVKAAYGRAYQVPVSRVDVKARLPEEKLDVAIRAPPGDIRLFRRLVESGLGGTFRLSARTEEREVDVMLLTTRNAGALRLTPTASTGGSMMSTEGGAGHLVAKVINGTTADLASSLESRLVPTRGEDVSEPIAGSPAVSRSSGRFWPLARCLQNKSRSDSGASRGALNRMVPARFGLIDRSCSGVVGPKHAE
jgi:hypothetical protein